MSAQPPTLSIPKVPLMFVDIEAGPDQAYIWLISVLVEGRPDLLRQFYAKTPASEKDTLNNFLSYCKEFNSCVICHYGGFDERLTRRQMTTYGLNSSSPGRWFDLQDSIKKSGILSFGSSSSLKHVAGYFGYVSRQQDINGTSVPRMYVQNICKQDGTITKKILEYGEDDVRALQCIMSAISDDNDIRLDRSWTPPEYEFPSSFEEQCALVKSLKSMDMSIPSIAKRFCIGAKHIRTRWQAAPEEWKGRKVSFETRSTIETGIPSGGAGSECGFQACRKDCTMHGEVIEQVSENAFRVRADETIFQVHKDILEAQ